MSTNVAAEMAALAADAKLALPQQAKEWFGTSEVGTAITVAARSGHVSFRFEPALPEHERRMLGLLGFAVRQDHDQRERRDWTIVKWE